MVMVSENLVIFSVFILTTHLWGRKETYSHFTDEEQRHRNPAAFFKASLKCVFYAHEWSSVMKTLNLQLIYISDGQWNRKSITLSQKWGHVLAARQKYIQYSILPVTHGDWNTPEKKICIVKRHYFYTAMSTTATQQMLFTSDREK